jgi:adenosylcobinamide-GDP ribazoletransferase
MTSLSRALGLFTIVPVRPAAPLTPAGAARALRWLPLVGAGLGAVAGLPAAGVRSWAPHAGLVGAVLSIAVLAVLTRGLHLDGLADTADGLGSRAPAERALAIMRRSDIGPFGVLTIAFVLLLDVAAVDALPGGRWAPVAALAVAAATGRVAALAAAHRRIRSAHASGFGALVAGSVSTPVLGAGVVLVLGCGAALAAAVSADVAGWVVAQAAGLVVGAGFTAHCRRRLGGVTGDVFGAVVELAAAATLAGLALA